MGLKWKFSFPHFRKNFSRKFPTKIDENSGNSNEVYYLGYGAYDCIIFTKIGILNFILEQFDTKCAQKRKLCGESSRFLSIFVMKFS
jgi:hypothetical protein